MDAFQLLRRHREGKQINGVVLGDRYAKLDGAQAWAAFLFASYLFGHLKHQGHISTFDKSEGQ